MILRYYAVLATVSRGYPPPNGTFLFITHPCATLLTPEGAFSFDLHVLSTPPAFVLSQDQTLRVLTFTKIQKSELVKKFTRAATSKHQNILFSKTRIATGDATASHYYCQEEHIAPNLPPIVPTIACHRQIKMPVKCQLLLSLPRNLST